MECNDNNIPVDPVNVKEVINAFENGTVPIIQKDGDNDSGLDLEYKENAQVLNGKSKVVGIIL